MTGIRIEHGDRHLLRAKDHIDRHYAKPLDVGQLAEIAGLSPAHFSREFKRAFGQSPHQMLLTRRIERAAYYLRMTDRSVNDVCLTVGLASVGSFTTSFKAHYGMTPLEYRERHPPASAWAVVPSCVTAFYGRPQKDSRNREDSGSGRP